jgi:uncharacterized protein (TIRG00374 family)
VALESVSTTWIRAVVLSTIAAGTIYLATVIWAGRVEVSAALKLVNLDTLLVLLALSLLNYGLRFARWHFYLRALGSSVSIRHNLRIYIGGFALTATPGKVGEIARSLWLRPYGVAAASSLAAFFAERIQDFLAIALLASFGATLYRGAQWLVFVSLGLAAGVLFVLQGPPIVEKLLAVTARRWAHLTRMARRVSEMLALTRGCLSPGRFVLGLAIGMLAWGAEALAFFVLLRALGHPLALQAAISIYALAMLAGAVSFMPGGLGGSEATMILLLTLFGISLPTAVSATLIIRLATLWFAVLLGILALAVRTRIPPLTTAASTPTEAV